jgi:glycerol-3-phosphate dehydrogenase (NAD(P)+)
MSKAVGVIGAGGWGSALAKLLCEKGHDVSLWCHGEQSYQEILTTRENRSYLPGIVLPRSLRVTRSLGEAVVAKDLVVCAVPSHAVRAVMQGAASHAGSHGVWVCCTKGIEEGTLKMMGEVLCEVLGSALGERLAFISGPNFALEVAQGLPGATTVAAQVPEVAGKVQEEFGAPSLRIYTSTDVIGVQLGGVVKNVIAIAAGISDGLGLGHNARAALITRGLAEMTRLAVTMGADPLTLSGLPGLGDLILTCTSDLSRNRQVGREIAQGKSLEQILGGMRMVAEGVKNTRCVHELAARLSVDMPIVEQMHQVLYQGKHPREAVRDLMQRALKAENHW